MAKMKDKKTKENKSLVFTGRECAYAAIFVALTIAAQLALSAIPGVEIVTLLFVAYAFTLGTARGMICATAFSLIRQLIFGFYPTVLILYLVYYNLLCIVFGFLGKYIKEPVKFLWVIVVIACICTILFTMMDCVITPLWYGYTKRATEIYFKAALGFMIPQVICTAITITLLFLPFRKVFLICTKK